MTVTRRTFMKAASAAAATLKTSLETETAAGAVPAKAAVATERTSTSYAFLSQREASFIESAVARLIPSDSVGPGATEAGVPNYIDKQLSGAWGAGERLYRSGPWHAGEPTQGYQLPFTPAELFRHALRAIDRDVQTQFGTTFAKLSSDDQDRYLKGLEQGHQDLNGIPANVFFESLLSMTIEGYFSDPVYGGNKDMAAWRMIGFPGAYATYYHLVDQHNLAFEREPMSLAENGRGDVHVHPQIPAYVTSSRK